MDSHYQVQQTLAMDLDSPPGLGCCLSCGSPGPFSVFHSHLWNLPPPGACVFDCSTCVITPFLVSPSCASLIAAPPSRPFCGAPVLVPGPQVLSPIQAAFPHSPSVIPPDCRLTCH